MTRAVLSFELQFIKISNIKQRQAVTTVSVSTHIYKEQTDGKEEGKMYSKGT